MSEHFSPALASAGASVPQAIDAPVHGVAFRHRLSP